MTTAGAPETQPLVLFGGTFDPVHEAHIRCARAVSEQFDHCPVYLLPNAVPPHRIQPHTSGAHRRAMLELACAGDPQLRVDDRELRRAGPSYTLDTLREYRAEIGERPLIFLLGADSYARLHQWRDWRHFPDYCHLAVAPRPGAPRPPPSVEQAFPPARQPAELLQSPAGRALLLESPELDIAATHVRDALEQGSHIDTRVPPAVLDYIRRHGLYTRS